MTSHRSHPSKGSTPGHSRDQGIVGRTILSALIVVTITACSSNKPASDTDTPATATADTAVPVDMTAVKVYELTAPVHVETPVSYPQSPPVGGDHNPAWQNCGFYPDAVQNETAAHSMEHGAVWIAYRPDLPAADIEILRTRTINQTHLLVSEFPGLTSALVLTAWGHQLALDSVDDPRFAVFVSTYQQGAQTPEPGAPCTGAIGQPQ